MKVVSPAGEFEIKVNESSVEDGKIVIKGQMGVWDSNIYMEVSDVIKLTRLFLNPRIMWHLLKSLF